MTNNKFRIAFISISAVVIIALGIWGWRTWDINNKVELSKKETDSISRSTTIVSINPDNTSTNTPSENLMPTEQSPTPQNQSEVVKSNTPTIIANGKLEGNGRYMAEGNFDIIENQDKIIIQFSEDFAFSGGPDPVIYLTKSPGQKTLDSSLILGQLQKLNGSQAYEISRSEYNQFQGSVMIWCRAFAVYMGGGNIASV